jgi:cytoskeletal protein RodZ
MVRGIGMASVGETLSAQRRRLGKTLAEAEAATCIRGRMLEALERGNHEALPSPAYVKGYIQSYAQFLDLETEPLLEAYKSEARLHDERIEQLAARPTMPRGAAYSKASRQNLEDVPAAQIVPKREYQHAIPKTTWIAIAVVIVLAGAVMWGVSRLFSRQETPPTVPAAVEQPAAPSAAATGSAVATEPGPGASSGATVAPGVSGEPSVAPPPGRAPIRLTFRIRPGETSTLRVTVDGVVGWDDIISDTNKPPEIKVYEEAVIVIGKPIWVTTFKDGTRVPTPNETTSYTLTIRNDKPAQ